MHILRADQGHNVLLYSGIHLTGKLDELLRIFLIRRAVSYTHLTLPTNREV